MSEEGLEAANKHIRRYLETHARKTSLEDQMSDVMNRLLERSHPDVIKNKIQYKRNPVQCVDCGARTHSSSHHKLGPLTEIYSLVESLLMQ